MTAFGREKRLQVLIVYRKVMLVMQYKHSKPPTEQKPIFGVHCVESREGCEI